MNWCGKRIPITANRIEGQSTHPLNIARAARHDFSSRPAVARLRLSDNRVGRVRFGLPLDALNSLFPNLYPEVSLLVEAR